MKVSLRLKSAIYTFIKQRFISDMGTKQDKTVDRNASINSVKYQFSVLWRGLNTTCLRDSFDSDTKFWRQKHSRDSNFRDHLSEYKLYVCVLSHFSCVWLFATLCTPWVPLSMGFSRQEYWGELLFPSSEDFPDPGIKPASLMSPALAGRFFTSGATWEAQNTSY